MSAKPFKNPGQDHPITVTGTGKRVVVKAGGQTIADSSGALSLKEASYPVVQYIPRKDVRMDLLSRTDHSSHCPYKGDASYYSVKNAGAGGVNAAWSYEQPNPAVAQIKDHVAFYPDRVDSIDVVD